MRRIGGLFPQQTPAHVNRCGRPAFVSLGKLAEVQKWQLRVQFPQALTFPPRHACPDDVSEIGGCSGDEFDPLAPTGNTEPATLGADVNGQRPTLRDQGRDARRNDWSPVPGHGHEIDSKVGRHLVQSGGQTARGGQVGIEIGVHGQIVPSPCPDKEQQSTNEVPPGAGAHGASRHCLCPAFAAWRVRLATSEDRDWTIPGRTRGEELGRRSDLDRHQRR